MVHPAPVDILQLTIAEQQSVEMAMVAKPTDQVLTKASDLLSDDDTLQIIELDKIKQCNVLDEAKKRAASSGFNARGSLGSKEKNR